MSNAEIKLFVTSMLMLEALDEIEGSTIFKQKLKFHCRELSKQLDELLSVKLDDGLSLFLTDANRALEDSIDNRLNLGNDEG